MTYRFEITIKPCVNFATHAAEVAVVDHTYDGQGKGIIVGQKHIESFATNDKAQAAAEAYCAALHAKLAELAVAETQNLKDAQP